MAVIEKITIQELRRRGISITPGSKYIPRHWISKKIPSLQAIHKILSKIKGSLDGEISRMREEEG